MPLADIQKGFCYSELFRELRLMADGELPEPTTEAVRHHYVPQLLLRRFSPRRERIWQLDTGNGRTDDQRIDRAASKRRLYEFKDEDGEPNADTEAWLALIEKHAAPALRRMESPGPILGLADWDRATIAFFLALLRGRTPATLKNLEQFSAQALQVYFGSFWSDDDTFAEQWREQYPEATSEEIKEAQVEALAMLREGRIRPEDPLQDAMHSALMMSGEMSQVIFESSWTVLYAEDGEFVTSDVGLAMHDPDPKSPWAGVGWQSSPAVQVTIPLSSTACLLVMPGPAEFGRMPVDSKTVDLINLRTFGWADRFVFGSSENQLKRVARLAAQRPEDVIRPRPMKQVILVDAEPGDTSLADEHRQRGWPPYMAVTDECTGIPSVHDYMVVGEDGEPLEVAARTTEISKQRAGPNPGKLRIRSVPRDVPGDQEAA
jgi:hypothetical protein